MTKKLFIFFDFIIIRLLTDRDGEVLCSLQVVRFAVRVVMFPKLTNETNGKPTLIEEIVTEIDKRSGEHDGVTILGGEPFDQIEGLEKLVKKLKEKNYHLTDLQRLHA